MKIETIETPRLALRGFTPEDAPFAISLWNDPVTGRWLSDPALEAIPDIEAYTKSVEGLGDSLDCCHLVAVDRATGQRIGTCSFVPENGGRSYDIAYAVHPDFQRQGYGTEIVEGLIGYVRSRRVNAVTICIARENAASNSLARKVGALIIAESSYTKGGTNETIPDYLYELKL